MIDCHAHLYHNSRPTWKDDDRKLIEAGDRLGIDQFCCSILTPRRPATAEGFRDLSLRERACLVPLVAGLLFCGFYPKPLLEIVRPTVLSILSTVK